MRKILIPPRFSHFMKMTRAHAITSVTDYLIDEYCLPVMPFAHTNLDCMDRALVVADHYLEGMSGMVLQGGSDVCPSWYNQENRNAKQVQRHRDIFEIALVKRCYKRGIPMLGLCRGMQLINVALGGTLHQELPADRFNKHIHIDGDDFDNFALENMKECHHDIHLQEDGVLYSIYNEPKLLVNSYHHQGVDTLAENLREEASSPDGLIESFSQEEKGILGLQWHPELDIQHPENVKLFRLWLSWCQ